MANINIQIQGLDSLLKKFGYGNAIIQKEIGSALAKSVLSVKREAKIEVPVDTAILQKSIQVFKSLAGKPLEGQVKATAEYASFVENGMPIGTGPHGGPKPFMEMGAKNAVSTIERVFKDAVDSITNQLVK